MQVPTQVRMITDETLEGYFIEIKVSEIMREQQLQRNIKSVQVKITKEARRFNKLQNPTLKHKSGVLLAQLRAQLITDQALLSGLVTAKESIDDYRGIPF